VTNRLQELKETVKKNNDKYKRRTVLPSDCIPETPAKFEEEDQKYSHLTASRHQVWEKLVNLSLINNN
jgi:hypothetical protein